MARCRRHVCPRRLACTESAEEPRRDPQALGFTDLLFNGLLGFAVMFVLAYLMINPTAKTGAVDNKAEFLVTLSWPDGRRDDVDVYVLDPDGNLVGYG